MFDFCHFCTQYSTLAKKNSIIKRRNWSTVLFEWGVPVLIIYALVIVKQQIKPKDVGATLPDSMTGIVTMKVSTFLSCDIVKCMYQRSIFFFFFFFFFLSHRNNLLLIGHRPIISSYVEKSCVDL